MAVSRQLDAVYARAIESGFSIKQNKFTRESGSAPTIGGLKSTSISMRNYAYADIYNELDKHNIYHLKFPDGGLIQFQYRFDQNSNLKAHRLAYFPSPTLPTHDEAPELYDRDDLYGDIILNRIVRFPLRFDFDPDHYEPIYHPHAHLTLGQFENCRIPASHPLSPNAFFLFIARNFYFKFFRRNQNLLLRKMPKCATTPCITTVEQCITSLAIAD